jgi:putative DNA primase/helicase
MTASYDPVDYVLARLEGVKPVGVGFMARCPAHDDRNPSLKIDRGDEGHVLLHCFVGCSVEAILDAMGLTMADLYPDEPARQMTQSLVASYDYVDEAGTLLYQNLRYGPRKDFRARRPDGAGGWLWKLGGVRRVPYRLTQLLAAPIDAPVILCEGEKDADRLGALGLLSSCHKSIGSGWHPDLTPYFAGRSVVILPDNDHPGRDYAQKAATALAEVAASVTVLELPGLHEGEDVSDWLDTGGTAERLREIVESAPRWEPAATVPPVEPCTLVRASEIEAEEISWLWAGYVPRGTVTLLEGDPGKGKSTLTAALAAAISTGAPLPGDTGRLPGRVLIVSLEDHCAQVIRPRLEAAGADLTRVLILKDVAEGDGSRLPMLPDDLALIRDIVDREVIELVIIDPFAAALSSSVDSYKDQSVRQVLARVARDAEETGAAYLIVRHLNKAAGGKAIYRGGGSIGIIGAARSALLLETDPNDPGTRVLAVTKGNLAAKPQAVQLQITSAPNGMGRVEWGAFVDTTSDELLAAVDTPTRTTTEQRTKNDEATEWLGQFLADGPQKATEVKRFAEIEGITEKPLNEAKRRLGVTPQRNGFGQGSYSVWHLPSDLATPRTISSGHASSAIDDPGLHRSPLRDEGIYERGGHLWGKPTPASETQHPATDTQGMLRFDDSPRCPACGISVPIPGERCSVCQERADVAAGMKDSGARANGVVR